jgi:hypothetical protein
MPAHLQQEGGASAPSDLWVVEGFGASKMQRLMTFQTEAEALKYAEACPAHTRIVHYAPEVGDAEKVQLAFVPPASIIYEALGFADGAAKYGPFNWRHDPVEAMTYLGAAQRHILAWQDGEEIASDSLKPHLGHAKACLGILIDSIERGDLIDNRPPAGTTSILLAEYEKLKDE